jgi:YD repeat-containing protein
MRMLSLLAVVSFALCGSLVMAQRMENTVSEFGLRGPVKQCIEHTTYPPAPGTIEQHSTTTISFAPDGRVLALTTQFGDGPPNTRSYSTNEPGPLSDKAAHPEIDANGRRIKLRKFPKYELRPNVAIGSTQWENSEIQFTPPSDGTLTTLYDDKDRPREAEVRDAGGQITLRIVREYDEKGRVKGDKVMSEQPDSTLLEQFSASPETSELSDVQKRALVAFMAHAFHGGESTLKYDDHDRVIEKHVKRGGIQDELTKTTYNDQGDIAEETVTRTESPEVRGEFGMDDAGHLVSTSKPAPVPPQQSTTRYTYEYDPHGNWIRKTSETRQSTTEGFTVFQTTDRTIAYY